MLICLIVVNAAVYLLLAAQTGELSWSAFQLLRWGGNFGELTLHGQPWRLLFALFLHAGVQHILGNMTLLAVTGGFLEAKLGPYRFLAAYLACGVAGGLLSASVHPDAVSVGASGAIAGLLGIMVAFYASGRHPEISGRWIAQVVGVNALFSLVPGVNWLAHLGGFGVGLVAGALLPARQA